MQKLFLLFSHTLTPEQLQEAKKSLRCSDCIYLPDELQKKWSNVKPEGEIDQNVINIFISYLRSQSAENDYVLIQGDFGLCYALVKWCNDNSRIPLYSTTYRQSHEEKEVNGEIKRMHLFKHINFRRYPK